MKLTLEKLEQLDQDFEKFKANLVTTESENLKEIYAFIEKNRPNKTFQYWALMMLDREKKIEHSQNLASKVWELEDRINELLGRGDEVVKERDELLEAIKVHAPDWGSKLLWCVEMAEEPDSPFEQIPAISKDIAHRVIKRYHAMHNNSYHNKDIADSVNSRIRVSMWHGAPEDHAKKILFDEAWFDLPMFNCNSEKQIDQAFKAKDLVKCTHQDKVLVTKDIDEAKRFFEVA